MPATDRLSSALADRYSIERELGAGGMATVYLARDLKHDRDVALKVLREELSSVIGTERFLSEVRIAARLDHPHILTLIDSGSADGILYYVLPYVRGESLRAKLDREKQLDVQDALSIITQVASALDYAHGQKVVHRDIKPENIMLHEGEAVLADFGIALAIKEAGGDRFTQTGLTLGTPRYMSPEQAMGDRLLDHRSDVYSLGAVFYEMIAGEPPVSGPSAMAVIAKLLTEKPVKLRVLRETISLAMEQATEKALAKTAADRFGSAGEFAKALSSAAPEPAKHARRSRTKWAAVAVVALAAICAAVWYAGGNAGPVIRGAVALRDRTQITTTGNVSYPQISDDGKMIAYVVSDCEANGCTYGLELKDVTQGTTRLILEGASYLGGLELSPDKRNVIIDGSINGVSGWFLVSTLGGPARKVTGDGAIAFWAGGDSLLIGGGGFEAPADSLWIFVAGLDGVRGDSIPVEGAVTGLSDVPNSQRLVYQVLRGGAHEWVSADRNGKRISSIRFPLGFGVGFGTASSEALWISSISRVTGKSSVIRIPLDRGSGRLDQQGDTVYTGRPTAISVTADGGTLLLDERTTEYVYYATSFGDLLKGQFTTSRRFLQATSIIDIDMSPDGKKVLLGRNPGSEDGMSQLSISSFEGGPEDAIPGRHNFAWFVDSTTLGTQRITGSGMRVSLLDTRTWKESAVFSVDSSIRALTRLKPAAWAWIPAIGRIISVQRDDERHLRKIQFPPQYRWIHRMKQSPDDRFLAVAGMAMTGDAVAIGMLSLDDGRYAHLVTKKAFGASLHWLEDGWFLIEMFDTPETTTFYRVRIGGEMQRIGSPLRRYWHFAASRDLSRAIVSTREFHGDAWISKVVGR